MKDSASRCKEIVVVVGSVLLLNCNSAVVTVCHRGGFLKLCSHGTHCRHSRVHNPGLPLTASCMCGAELPQNSLTSCTTLCSSGSFLPNVLLV